MSFLRLASNSPRRRQLLSLVGIPFSVTPVDIDESSLPEEAPPDYVLRLALEKARAALGRARPDEIILTADTTVADGSRILGKPSGPADAREMLLDLRGRPHTVYTAIGVADSSTSRVVTDLCATTVWMREYSPHEVEAYIESGDPFDKAGAYAIQHQDFHPAERIEGCYACVMGLPLCHVIRALRKFGLQVGINVSDACPEYLEIDSPCPITRRILENLHGETYYDGKG